MIKHSNIKAIVIGHDHYNTLGLVRSLGEIGISPTLILISSERKKSFVAKSKYINGLITINETEIIDTLKLLGNKSNKPIIFSTSDRIANIIDKNYDELSIAFHLSNINGKAGNLSKAMDKERMREKAEEFGFNVPKTVVIRKKDSILDFPFPCLIKIVDSAAGKKDYGVYRNTLELTTGLNRMFEYAQTLQIQQYLNKSTEIIYLGWSHEGHVCIPCMMTKIRDYPVNFGCTGLGQFTPDVNTYFKIDKLINLIKSYNYSGIFSVEFILCDNTPYFLEINFRNDGNGYFPGFTGEETNLAYNYILAVKFNQFHHENYVIKHPFQMMREFTDLEFVRETDYSWLRWLHDMRKTDVFQIWNCKDPAPFLKMITNRLFRK